MRNIAYIKTNLLDRAMRICTLGLSLTLAFVSFENAFAQAEFENLARQFAPVLRFDKAQQGYPMSAQVYFDDMLCGQAGGPVSVCDPDDPDNPCDPEKLEGAQKIFDACKTKDIPYMPTSFQDLVNTPTYYSATACGTGQVRIRYWWYYGHQPSCGFTGSEVDIPTPFGNIPIDVKGKQGEHIADWEHIDVVLSIDQSQVAAVKFAQHTGWYTRIAASGEAYFGKGRGFEIDADGRPIVYVGRQAHGSYYDSHTSQLTACAYFDDNRRPEAGTSWNTGQSPFIDLTGSAEPWLEADRTATWNWGYDKEVDGNSFSGSVGTHPTQSDKLASCNVKMCDGLGEFRVSSELIPEIGDDLPYVELPFPMFQQFADSGCWASNCPTGMCGGMGPAVYDPKVSATLCGPWLPFVGRQCFDVASFISDALELIFVDILGFAVDLISNIPVLGDLVLGVEGVVQQVLIFSRADVFCGNVDVFSEGLDIVIASGRLTAASCSSDLAFKDAFLIPVGDTGVLEPGQPNSPPVADAGADFALECESPEGTAAGLFGSLSYDPDNDPLTYTWTGPFSEGDGVSSDADPIVTLPLGENELTLTVSDGEFNDSDTVIAAIWDTTQPEIEALTANPATLWPPNHKMREVTVTLTVTDICDSAPVCTIASITSNEADNGNGDGNSVGDSVITGPLTALLRAERSGNGSGRVYELTVRCMDASSNSSSAVVSVSVNHDKRKRD